MKYRNSLTGILAVTLIALATLANSAETKLTHKMVEFASGSVTGSWYPIAAKVAEMTNDTYYEGKPISVVPGGGTGNVLRVARGKSELGVSMGAFLKLGTEGNNAIYSKPEPNLRAIAALVPSVSHMIATKESGITKLSDLSKENANLYTAMIGDATTFAMEETLKYMGMNLRTYGAGGDGRLKMVSTKGRVDAWKNNKADFINFLQAAPGGSINEVMAVRPGVFVEADPDIIAHFEKQFDFTTYVLPAGTYPNQDKDLTVLGQPLVFFASDSLDDELAYNIAKTIAENKEKLITVSPGFKNWKPENMPFHVGAELHPGAAKYYRERGWIK